MSLRFWRLRDPRSASDWFARLRSGKISQRVDARFQDWLERDPSHERAYERRELAWELSGELAQDAEIRTLVRETEQALAASDERTAARKDAALRLGWAAASVLLITSAGAVWWSLRPSFREHYATEIGEQRTVILPDRSQITLNTATRMRVSYTRSIRAIELEQGEATFSVTHDPARPFEVAAAGGKARALGTEFNVLERDQGATVSVLEGKVEVLAASNEAPAGDASRTIISGGEEVTYAAGRLSSVQPSHTQRINAWHNGRIAFQDVTLEEALAEFNRYSPMRLVLGDRALAAYRVTGVFRVGEMHALLRALKDAFGVTAVREGNAIVLRPEKPAAPDATIAAIGR